jgi:excisionase family DNA binding protein
MSPEPATELQALLTVTEVAELLAVSERTLKRLVTRGFPCLRVGRSLRFEPQAVARWLSARREGA